MRAGGGGGGVGGGGVGGGGGGGGGGKITPLPCLKLGRIMQEISNLAHKYTHICSFRKYTFYYQDPLNFAVADVS